MAALILPSPSPPRGPAPVNWANPITRGLVIAYFASSNFDHAGTRVPNNTDKTNNQQSANQYGAAMRFTGSQALNTLTIDHKVTHNLSGATAMTVVTVTTAAAGAERPICGVWGSTKRWYMAIDSSGYPIFAVNGGAANRVYTSNVVTAHSARTSLAAVWDGSSDTCKLYKAGAEISGGKSGTAQTAIGSHTMGPSIGSQSTGGTAKHSGTIEYVLVFNRALSDAEIRSISENPYQVLRPANDRLWLDVVAGGGGVSGSLSAIDAPDTASFSGAASAPSASGALSASDAQDIASFTGALIFSGSLSATDSPDAATFAGTAYAPGVSGTFAATDSADAAAFAGTAYAPGVSGTLAATDGADSAAFTGALSFVGALAAVEVQDSSTVAGAFGPSGSLAATDQKDSATFAGSHASGAAGSMAASDQSDVAVFAGVVDNGGLSIVVDHGRVLVVPRQSRALAVSAESRVLTIAPQSRVLTIQGE